MLDLEKLLTSFIHSGVTNLNLFDTGNEPTTSFNLFVGNLNFNKSAPELKTGISDLFAKNDLAVVDVRIGVSR